MVRKTVQKCLAVLLVAALACSATFMLASCTNGELQSIEITTQPTKTQYVAGETFNPAGMVVTATYEGDKTKELAAEDYTYAPADELATSDRYITVSYTENEVTRTARVRISVTNDVTAATITQAPDKTEYVAGEIFDPTGMVLSVTYQDKSTDTLTVESPSDVDFDDSPLVSGQTSVEITIGQATVTQAITVRTGVFIEAEDGIIDSTGADINTDSAEATGGAYVGDMKSGDTLSFQLRAEKAGTAEIVFRLASQYLKQDDNWTPIWMGDCQLNKIMKVYVNEVEQDIDDSVILPGGGAEGGTPDASLWFNWMDVEFGDVELREGRNEITIEFIRHDYADCSQDAFNNVFTANIDSMKVITDDNEIEPVKAEITAATLGTEIGLEERDGKVWYVVAGGTFEYESSGLTDEELDVMLGSLLKSYYYFDLEHNANMGASGWLGIALENTHIVTVSDDRTGFELAVDVTDLEVSAYTTHLREVSANTGSSGWNDFKPDVDSFTDSVTLNGKVYTMSYTKGGGDDAYFGCVGLKIANA